MPTFSPQEVHFAVDGQTDVVLDHPYLVGQGEIAVFLNGILSVIGEDYIELDEYRIQFTFQLSSDDIIITQHHVYFDDKNITVIGEKNRSMFQRYGDIETLLHNQKYTFSFVHADQEFSTSFYTKLNPFYSTIKRIQSDLGDIIDDVTDERLAFLIFDNSILSQNIASEENLALLESEDKVPYVFKQFVRYRTELDLMTSVYLQLSGRQGEVKKTLGELEISRKQNFGALDLKGILSELKGKLKEWEKLLRGTTASSPVRSAIRGGSTNPYPLASPRMTNTTGIATGG